MVDVRDQYEAYPYPERDPGDETARLILGSPSDPREMDHHLWGGRRDWSTPLRVLVAGGGTGDGLIQLAQLLTLAKRPYEITYVDLSKASRAIAEERAKVRGLTGIRFETGSLLGAADYGEFDYIDCCGVLHHLPDPTAGFAALRAACAPGGGLGFMVYAPYGRSGVYPLQEAFGALLDGLAPQDRLARAREIMERLPEGHPFKTNPHVVDHKTSDAGFYDLLLHSQDQAMSVMEVLDALDGADWALGGFTQPAAYHPGRFGVEAAGLDDSARMVIAEKLDGTMKVHVGYARPKGAAVQRPSLDSIPHLMRAKPAELAQRVAKGQALTVTFGGKTMPYRLPKEAASLLAVINGQRSLRQIVQQTKTSPETFKSVWPKVEAVLVGWGQMVYSSLLKR